MTKANRQEGGKEGTRRGKKREEQGGPGRGKNNRDTVDAVH
jgi:hypothetical protein